jgi:protein involved in polysaccharide export with SLBB domain
MRALAVKAMVAILLCAVCSAHARAQVKSSEVRLRPGDAVRLEVKDEPALSAQFLIGHDGALMLPLVGSVAVAGRPFNEVTSALQDAIAKQLVSPVIRVTPLVRIAVLGEVRSPGLILVDPTHTIADVIALAGGLGPNANSKRVLLSNASGVLVFRQDQLQTQTTPILLSGDQIRVEKRSWVNENLAVLIGAAGSLSVALLTAVLVRQ